MNTKLTGFTRHRPHKEGWFGPTLLVLQVQESSVMMAQCTSMGDNMRLVTTTKPVEEKRWRDARVEDMAELWKLGTKLNKAKV